MSCQKKKLRRNRKVRIAGKAVYISVTSGEKILLLACRKLERADSAGKSWREVLAALKRQASESRSSHLAYEMYKEFLQKVRRERR